MAETPQPEQPAAPRGRRGWLRALAPHALTALSAAALSLAVQLALPRAPAPAAAPATPPIATATAAPTSAPPPTPAVIATAPPPASGITRQELLDLRVEDDRLWSAVYLSRAISQIADAEAALRTNDLDRADQLIVAIDDSLSLAYRRTPDALRDPIAQMRRDTGVLREDLYLRPEGLDLRLAQLRQTLVTLIAERR